MASKKHSKKPSRKKVSDPLKILATKTKVRYTKKGIIVGDNSGQAKWRAVMENIARTLMKMDNRIWTKYKWTSGSAVDQAVYLREVTKLIKPKSIPALIGLILEDANYHTLNGALLSIGAFTEDPWTKKVEAGFRIYRDYGGRTWQL